MDRSGVKLLPDRVDFAVDDAAVRTRNWESVGKNGEGVATRAFKK